MSIVVADQAELHTMIANAVREGLAEQSAQNENAGLLDRIAMAKYLGISPSQLDRLRQQGLPCVRPGVASPRFHPARCVEWLQARDANAPTPIDATFSDDDDDDDDAQKE